MVYFHILFFIALNCSFLGSLEDCNTEYIRLTRVLSQNEIDEQDDGKT